MKWNLLAAIVFAGFCIIPADVTGDEIVGTELRLNGSCTISRKSPAAICREIAEGRSDIEVAKGTASGKLVFIELTSTTDALDENRVDATEYTFHGDWSWRESITLDPTTGISAWALLISTHPSIHGGFRHPDFKEVRIVIDVQPYDELQIHECEDLIRSAKERCVCPDTGEDEGFDTNEIRAITQL